jgi:multidrug efflux system outer membrane protein
VRPIRPFAPLAAGFALLLSGCTMIPAWHRPAPAVATAWPTGNEATDRTDLPDWRRFYRDPVMRHLVELALANNRDLRIAQHQVEAASAQFDIENAALFPTLNGGALANIQKEYARIWSLSHQRPVLHASAPWASAFRPMRSICGGASAAPRRPRSTVIWPTR